MPYVKVVKRNDEETTVQIEEKIVILEADREAFEDSINHIINLYKV